MHFKSFSNTGYILHRNHGHLCFLLGATLHIAKDLLLNAELLKAQTERCAFIRLRCCLMTLVVSRPADVLFLQKGKTHNSATT